jgi:uncharacterized membrane protein
LRGRDPGLAAPSLSKPPQHEHATMSATLASPAWSSPGADAPWRFGRAWPSGDAGAGGVQWVLRRNCSVTPRQLGGFYLSMCLVSLLIASGFAFSGAPVVLAFAGLELLVLGIALLVYARHATDADTLTLSGPSLLVEQTHGSACRMTRFRAEWVSVEPALGDGSLVELSGQGQRVRIGRFLRPEMRAAFAQELRLALRTARTAP